MSDYPLVANLRFLAKTYPRIAPYQTVGVIEDLSRAASRIEELEKALKAAHGEFMNVVQSCEDGEVFLDGDDFHETLNIIVNCFREKE